MPDIFDLVGEEATTTDKGTIYDYPASFGEAFGAGVERAVDTNPLALGARALRTFSEDFQARFGGQEDNLVDRKAAEEEIRARGLDLKVPAGGITRYELDMLQHLKQREVRQNTVGARADGVTGVAAGFAGAFAGSFADPINVASNFIPFVSQYRYARWLAQAGESTLARAGVRAGAGAIEGAAGAAVIEPLVYAGATSLQLDYDSVDSFLNVTLGGVMGGGLHTIGGAVYDARMSRALRGFDQGIAGNDLLRTVAESAPENVKREAMQSAVAAMERGEPVDVEPQFKVHQKEVAVARAVEAAKEVAATTQTAPTPTKGQQLLVDTRGQGERFHGTSSPISALMDYYGNEASIYGVGFYTTDAVDIAQGYSKKGSGGQPTLYKVKERDGVKLFDMEQVVPDWLRKGDIHDLVDMALEEEPATVRELYDQIRALSRGEGVTRLEVQEIFDNITERMQREGYDGLRHIGGLKTGKAEHDVRIYWTPEKDFAGFERADFADYQIKEQSTPRDLGGLIQQSRADRTQEAFDRQFVDDAEATIAQDKARPKDRIEAVKQDETEFRDVVEEYREAGRLTAEDDKALKQADEMAAWAERRAKAFEAAAGCLETS